MISEDEEISDAMAAARARGRQQMIQFYNMSREDKIPHIAAMIYQSVELDPYGYPNGRPDFYELPDIDNTGKCGTDKLRYMEAAAVVYNRLMWKPEEDV